MLRQIQIKTLKLNIVRPYHISHNLSISNSLNLKFQFKKPNKPPESESIGQKEKIRAQAIDRKHQEKLAKDRDANEYLTYFRLLIFWGLWYILTTQMTDNTFNGHRSLPNLIKILSKKQVEKIEFFVKDGKIDYIFFKIDGGFFVQESYYIRPSEYIDVEEYGDLKIVKHVPKFEDTVEFLKRQTQELMEDVIISPGGEFADNEESNLTIEQNFIKLLDEQKIDVFRYNSFKSITDNHLIKKFEFTKLIEFDEEGKKSKNVKSQLNMAIIKANLMVTCPLILFTFYLSYPYFKRDVSRLLDLMGIKKR